MNLINNDDYFNTIPKGILGEIYIKSKCIWDMLKVKDTYLKKLEYKNFGKTDKTVIISNNCYIGSNTIIEPYCVIEGSVYIGKNCYIRPHSYIRAGTIIGDNVTVGHGVEVKNSIIFDECKLDSHSFVGDSIFGLGVRNGSGTITANRRFDQKDISISFNGDKIDTNLDKFGCIIGEYSRLGANCTTAPGVCIERHTWIYPNTFINESVKSNTLVKLRQKIESEEKEKSFLTRYDKHQQI